MDVAESVFRQLSCIPVVLRSIFQHGHSYGVPQADRVRWEGLREIFYHEWSLYFANPDNIPPRGMLEITAPTPFNSFYQVSQMRSTDSSHETSLIQSPQDTTAQQCTGSTSSLIYPGTRLPPELLVEMISYLAFTEVLKLRLVCRNFALIFKCLPRSYWRSRFCIGQEADFLFPNLQETRDWESLFRGTLRFLRERENHMLNRKRIRDLLEPIAVLCSLDSLFQDPPNGSIVLSSVSNERTSFWLCDGENVNNNSLSLEMTASFSGEMQAEMEGPLTKGCRVIHRRAQSLAAHSNQTAHRILISTSQIGCKRFISGIGISPEGEDNNITSRGLGYYIPSSIQQISHNLSLKSIAVAFCPEGLTRIKFTFEDSSSTPWLGDIAYMGVAFGSFSLHQNSCSSYLIAGLDNYKVVSLGLGVLTSDPKTSTNREPCINDAQSIPSLLWTPYPPSEPSVTVSKILPSQPFRTFDPLCNIDFQRPKGGVLTRFTCFLNHELPMKGIEVCYSDGESSVFGTKNGCELREVWSMDDLPTKSQQGPTFLDRKLEPPQKSKLVGIFVLCHGRDSLRFGGVYEPEEEETLRVEDC